MRPRPSRLNLPFLPALLLLVLAVASPPWSPSLHASPEDDHYKVASKAFADGLYSFSKSQLERFVNNTKNKGSVHFHEAQLLLGKSAYELKAYTSAARVFREIIASKSPHGTEAKYWLGLTLFKRKEYQVCISMLKKASLAFTGTDSESELLYTLGRAQFIKGQYADARFTLTQFVKKTSKPKERSHASFLVCQSYIKQGLFKEALDNLTLYLKKNNDTVDGPEAWFSLGEANYNLFHWSKASNAYLKALEYKRASLRQRANALYSLGWSFDKNNEHQKSLEYFVRFQETGLSPNLSTLVDFKIGELYYKLKKFEKSTAYFTHLQADKEYGKRATYWLARSAYELKNYEAAIKLFNYVLKDKKSPLYSEALLIKGYCQLATKQYALAISLFQEAYEQSGNMYTRVRCKEAMAEVDKQRGRMQAAIEVYSSIIKQHGDRVQRDKYLFLRGKLQAARGNINAASLDFQEITGKYPLKAYNIPAILALGKINTRKGIQKEAIKYFSKITSSLHASKRQKDEANYRIGIAQYNLKTYQEALKTFEPLTKAMPESHKRYDSYLFIVKCHEALKDYAQAETTYLTVLKAFSKSPMIDSIHYELGLFYSERKQPLKARVQFSEIVNHMPDSEYLDDSLYQLGLSALASKQDTLALSYWEPLLKMENAENRETIVMDIVDLHTKNKNYTTALKHLRDFLQNTTNETIKQTLHYQEGIVFQAQLDWRNARNSYQHVLAGAKNNTRLMAEIKLADCTVNIDNDYEKATKHYMNALYLYNDIPYELRKKTSLKCATMFIKLKHYGSAKTLLHKTFGQNINDSGEALALLKQIPETTDAKSAKPAAKPKTTMQEKDKAKVTAGSAKEPTTTAKN